ncbi:enoyl-CoA hydratase/isomerase family protein [Rhodococcus aetherivorans]
MTNDSSPLLVTQSGRTRVLTLHRPHRRNALDSTLVDALDDALTAAEQDPDTHAIVLAGAGRSFCAGADLQYFLNLHAAGSTPLSFLRSVSAFATRLETSPLPVVAAVHGHAVAGGLELALACDAVVATPTALIGDGHVRNNLLPAGGASVRLPRKVGDSTARWLALTGELVTAASLVHTGWLHTLVAEDDLLSEAVAIADTLAAHAGPAQSAYKRLLAELNDLNATNGLAHELDAFDTHWRTSDVPASLNAFLRRETPRATAQPLEAGA